MVDMSTGSEATKIFESIPLLSNYKSLSRGEFRYSNGRSSRPEQKRHKSQYFDGRTPRLRCLLDCRLLNETALTPSIDRIGSSQFAQLFLLVTARTVGVLQKSLLLESCAKDYRNHQKTSLKIKESLPTYSSMWQKKFCQRWLFSQFSFNLSRNHC